MPSGLWRISAELFEYLPHTGRLPRPRLAFYDYRLSRMADVKKDLVRVRRFNERELRKALRDEELFDISFHLLASSA